MYAKDKCTVKLYADAAPADLTVGILQEFTGYDFDPVNIPTQLFKK